MNRFSLLRKNKAVATQVEPTDEDRAFSKMQDLLEYEVARAAAMNVILTAKLSWGSPRSFATTLADGVSHAVVYRGVVTYGKAFRVSGIGLRMNIPPRTCMVTIGGDHAPVDESHPLICDSAVILARCQLAANMQNDIARLVNAGFAWRIHSVHSDEDCIRVVTKIDGIAHSISFSHAALIPPDWVSRVNAWIESHRVLRSIEDALDTLDIV